MAPIKISARLTMLLVNPRYGLDPNDRVFLAMLRDRYRRIEDANISVTPLVSASTGEGRVDVTFGGDVIQLSAERARAVAELLTRGADAAETEARLLTFLQHVLNFSPAASAAHLADWRAFRDRSANATAPGSERLN